jgi:hypothetical protein
LRGTYADFICWFVVRRKICLQSSSTSRHPPCPGEDTGAMPNENFRQEPPSSVLHFRLPRPAPHPWGTGQCRIVLTTTHPRVRVTLRTASRISDSLLTTEYLSTPRESGHEFSNLLITSQIELRNLRDSNFRYSDSVSFRVRGHLGAIAAQVHAAPGSGSFLTGVVEVQNATAAHSQLRPGW